MSRKTQRYPKEFKAEAVRTVLENQLSISEGASRLSLPEGSYRQIPEFTVRTQKITDMGQRNGTGQTSRIYCQHRR